MQPFTIFTPEKITQPLYQGAMTLVGRTDRRHSESSTAAKSPGPVVTLGQPQWWNLADLARENLLPTRSGMAMQAQLTHLRRLLTERFNLSELQTLCFDLAVDYESLPGQGRADKARELVGHMQRRGRIHKLMEIGARLRPDVSWPEMAPDDAADLSLPPGLLQLTRDADFYLVQLACSFRPQRQFQVEWAQFTAYLRPQAGRQAPIAFDLYPREISEQVRTNLAVSVTPALKFLEAGPALGTEMAVVQFPELTPVIFGFGALESAAGWEFEAHARHPLRGSRFSYLIVKKPRVAEAVRLTLDITVDVVTAQGLLSAKFTEQEHAHLTKTVCTD